MTREEILNTPELVDFMLDKSVIADSREKLRKRLEKVCNLAIKALEQQPVIDINNVTHKIAEFFSNWDGDENAKMEISVNDMREIAFVYSKKARIERQLKEKALEQEPCEDTISRVDALKALDYDIKSFEFKNGVSRHMNEIANLLNAIYEIQSNNIKALPPVQSKQIKCEE